MHDGTFDYNGYYPDGIFDFTWDSLGYVKYNKLAAARAALGIEMHGLILAPPIFDSGLDAPASRMKLLAMVTGEKSIARYLGAIGEPTCVPGRSPSRGPPYWKSVVLRRKVLGDIA